MVVTMNRGAAAALALAGALGLTACRQHAVDLVAKTVVNDTSAVAELSHTNRLAREKSPYLLQHQYNPGDWYAWGEEAFGKARRANQPIFLSIGYSTCHWCHVMERESFENPEVAAYLNAHFVSIKVDREERPDGLPPALAANTAALGDASHRIGQVGGGYPFPPRAVERHQRPLARVGADPRGPARCGLPVQEQLRRGARRLRRRPQVPAAQPAAVPAALRQSVP